MRLPLLRRLTVAAGMAAAVLLAAAPASAAPSIVVGPGSEIAIVQKTTAQGLDVAACTLGVLALTPSGERVGVTAGHCGKAGQQVGTPVPGRARTLAAIGTVLRSTDPKVTKAADGTEYYDPNEPDWATIRFARDVPLANQKGQVRPRTVGRAAVGDRVCRQGRTTGWQCGKVIDIAGPRILSDLRGDHGDSGGPLIRMSDGAALGIATSIYRGDDKGRSAAVESQFLDLGSIFAQAGGLRLAV